MDVSRRNKMHSSIVGHGCSRRILGIPSTMRAMTVASWRRQAPFASATMTSSSPVASTTARTRSASSAGMPPTFSWNRWIPDRAASVNKIRHLVGRAERDRHIQREVVLDTPAKQCVTR